MSGTEGLSVVRPELLQIAEAVARDKSIEQDIVIEAMEEAIQSAAKKKYGQELEVKAEIDKKSGEIKISRVMLQLWVYLPQQKKMVSGVCN